MHIFVIPSEVNDMAYAVYNDCLHFCYRSEDKDSKGGVYRITRAEMPVVVDQAFNMFWEEKGGAGAGAPRMYEVVYQAMRDYHLEVSAFPFPMVPKP